MRARALVAGLVVVITGCGGGGGSSGGGPTGPTGPGNPGTDTRVTTTSVAMRNSAFVPPAIRVSPSAVVTFTNEDGIDHNVTFASTSISSVGAYSSGTRTVTMPAAAGTYSFSCTLHTGMNGSVQVQ
jgi:plastocyanin